VAPHIGALPGLQGNPTQVSHIHMWYHWFHGAANSIGMHRPQASSRTQLHGVKPHHCIIIMLVADATAVRHHMWNGMPATRLSRLIARMSLRC
jgi:hypothetical protein